VGFGSPIGINELFPGKVKGDDIQQSDYKAATEKIQAAVKETWDLLDAEFK
ncbi:MAG: hypothetical protein GYA24_13805, partial [Candidatus Lokiarchaeota archaeon]|nr:hypothetical protein [Candidatus Lokiarchaeota archaeon]